MKGFKRTIIRCVFPMLLSAMVSSCTESVPSNENLALNRPVKASGSYDERRFGAAKAVDGSAEDSARSRDIWLLPDDSTGWIEIDLGQVTPIGYVRWMNARNGDFNDRGIADWTLEVSEDGSEYTQVGGGTAPFSKSPVWVEAAFPQVSARFVRLSVGSFHKRGGGIAEIEVFHQRPE